MLMAAVMALLVPAAAIYSIATGASSVRSENAVQCLVFFPGNGNEPKGNCSELLPTMRAKTGQTAERTR
jgi:hypothetical protein